MNCKNICNCGRSGCSSKSHKRKEGKCFKRNRGDSYSQKKCNDSPISFCQSFEKDGGIITDNEYEVKCENDIIEID